MPNLSITKPYFVEMASLKNSFYALTLYAMTLSIPNFILELLCPLLLSKLLSCPTASERSVLLSKKLKTTVSDLWRSLWEWDDRSDALSFLS